MASAKIKTQHSDDIFVIEFSGKLSIGEGDVMIRKAVSGALEDGFKKIVLDIRNARTMDSSGLGELVRAQWTVKKRGGTLVLVGVKDKVQGVLEMTRLRGVFEEFGSSEEAIAEISNR